MKSRLGKICLPRAIGLYVEDTAVTLSHVVATPIGPVETARHTETVDPDLLPDVLKRLVVPLLGWHGFRQVPVAIGLPVGRTYFTTRPITKRLITASQDSMSPKLLLRDSLRSSNISVHDMVADVIFTEPEKRPLAGVAACEKKYLAGLLDPLRGYSVHPFRAEPAPCALLRAAVHRCGANRRDKVLLRLFLGDTQALAMLVVNSLPVAWRLSSLPYGDEPAAILSLGRSSLTLGKGCGIESPLDAVVVHGHPADGWPSPLDVAWFQEQIGVPVRWFDEPPLEGSQIAFGLALGCLKRDKHALDLSRTLKRRPSLWRLVPWREVALQVAVLVAMVLALLNRCWDLEGSCEAAEAQNAQHSWMAPLEEPQLEKERKELGERVGAIQKFLGTRTIWTSCARELSACMPDNAYLTVFQGVSEWPKRKRKKAKKFLTLEGAVSIPRDGLTPREIDRLLSALRQHPTLKREFSVMTLTRLIQLEASRDRPPQAMFTVVCSPKTSKGKEK